MKDFYGLGKDGHGLGKEGWSGSQLEGWDD